MRPENNFFGGGSSETLIHPVVLVAMLITIVLIFLLPRKHVITPLLLIVFLTPLTQAVVIGGVHFFVLRILIIFAWIRLAFSKTLTPGGLFRGRLMTADKIFVLWAIFRALAFAFRFSFQPPALVFQAGFLLDALGGYFLLRYLIQEEEDIIRVIRVFAYITVVVVVAMVNERITHQNLFGYLGGIDIAPGLREGAYRCQGPFRNPILAGCFGATVLPLLVWLRKLGKAKVLSGFAILGSIVIVFVSASSTPVMALAAGICALWLWPLRNGTRQFRWGIVIGLLVLQMFMKAPVWNIITHFQLIGGSSNYQRAFLIDQFVRHFFDWWLIGTNNNGTWGWDMWDVSNTYVSEGVVGGLATFICFIALISLNFSVLGKARKLTEDNRNAAMGFWFLGCALIAHVVAFFGVTYFDQTQIGWYSLLAIISASTYHVIAKARESEPVSQHPLLLTIERSPQPIGVARNSAAFDSHALGGRPTLLSKRPEQLFRSKKI